MVHFLSGVRCSFGPALTDNLSSHKSAVAQAFLNPIEMVFSKLKAHLRRMKARTFGTLFESIAEACELFPQQECQNYFKAAGYVAHLMDGTLGNSSGLDQGWEYAKHSQNY